MASLAQIEANRRNSQKSTGPAPRRQSRLLPERRQNRLYAESLLIDGESPDPSTISPANIRPPATPSVPANRPPRHPHPPDWLLRRMRRVETLPWNHQAEERRKTAFRESEPEYAFLITWTLGRRPSIASSAASPSNTFLSLHRVRRQLTSPGPGVYLSPIKAGHPALSAVFVQVLRLATFRYRHISATEAQASPRTSE